MTTAQRTYDIYFAVSGGSRFFFKNPNEGIAIGDQGIAWTAEGRPDEASFADIAGVHLTTAALGQKVLDQCKIDFVNGTWLLATNGSATGLPDETRTPAYRAFVRDLHERLATATPGAVRFTAGMSQWRYKGLFAAMIVAGLLFVFTPLVIVAVTGDLHGLIIAGSGAALCVPFVKILMNNAPRDYTPDRVPNELLS